MKYGKFLLLGIFFAIVLTKSEAVSWYRIYEMFKFQSFHMYGIIGSAVILSMVCMQLFKRGIVKDYVGNPIIVKDKKRAYIRPLIGGIIFGLGWALAGACPAPIFILIGHGIIPMVLVLIGALLGAFVYGYFSKKLPT